MGGPPRGLQVAEMFPNMTVQFNVWASSPPHLTMRPAGLIFTPTLDTQAFAVLPNSSLAPLFVLGLVSCSQLWADEGTALGVGQILPRFRCSGA